MSKPLRVLILEDRPSDARLVLNELKQAGFDPQWERVDTEQDYISRLETAPDIILADYNLPQFSAPEALQILRKSRLDIPFIIVSGSIGEDVAVEAMRVGATDFLLKDRMGRLGQAVGRALEERQSRDVQRRAEESLRERTQIILLTAEVGLALNRSGSIFDMLQQCSQSLVNNLAAAFARIWTLNEEENVLELQASAGLYTHLDGLHRCVPVGKFKIGLIAQERKPHLTNDVLNDPRVSDPEWARREGMVSFAGYPLILEDRLVGVMAMFARQPLTPIVLDAMAAVANQIATGIERKRTEERLRFTQFTIDHIATAVFWSDAAGKFFDVNEAACRLTGYNRAELLALHIHDVDVNVTPKKWSRTWQEIQRRGVLSMDSRLRRKNGTEIPISIHTNLLQGAGRECSCTFMQDTIEREEAELAQRQSDLRFRAIFDHTFEFLGLLNCKGTVLEVNQPALDFRGLNRADVAGLPLWETQWLDMSGETRGHVRQAIAVAAGGGFVRNEITVRDAKQIVRTFDFSVKPVMNDASVVELLIVEARDITDQKRMEEQFRQAQKMEAVGKLAGGVAHDFNNLLTIMLGYSEMLQESLRTGDPLLELVAEIHKAGTRAASLTRQLLAFSRKQVLVPVVLNLNVLIAEMDKMLRRLIGEDIDLEFRPYTNLWQTRADSGQMEQVIMNLVVNARDAMPQGGKLSIETANVELDASYTATRPESRAGDHVLLAVSDTGCGMDKATLARIFEPFFTTKGEQGTGLGLATVYGIVKQSGGHIAAYSEPGYGTVFKIYLPREGDAVAGPTSATGANTGKLAGTETILLVEDEDAVRALARTVLQQHGYNVMEARCGDEAQGICERCVDAIHLLVTDVVMPNMSGRQLAEFLLATRAEMKVLYMSGYMDDAVVRHGLLNTGTHFLQKPFTPSGLAAKVRQVLDGVQ